MLSDGTIRKCLESGEIRIYLPGYASRLNGGLRDHQFQPASVDLRLGACSMDYRPGVDAGTYQLEAGQHVLASTAEYISVSSSLVGRVEGKSTWARRGLLVESAGFIDPGFHGQITLELKNLSHKPISLSDYESICQISFDWLDAPALRPYGHPDLRSHYQGQTGIKEAHNDRYA